MIGTAGDGAATVVQIMVMYREFVTFDAVR